MRRGTSKVLGLALALAVLWTGAARGEDAERPSLPKTKEERQTYAASVCTTIAARADENGLPPAFMARLIWKESLFDPGAVSPRGAQGIAQFMPGTAAMRGLADPFDTQTALAASAAYLAELRKGLGNLGLAAAAYNAGEDRVRRWIAGTGGLPYETQDYVMSITGRGADYAFDTTGNAAVVRASHDALNPVGTLALAGVGFGELSLNFISMISGRTITGVMEGDSTPREFIPHLARLNAEGAFPYDELITTFPLEQINEAEAASASGTVIKPVLTFG